MLNYGICQNDQISLSDVEGDAFEFDLSLYEEIGYSAYKIGDEREALKWYNRGLTLAVQLEQQDKIKLFSNLIFVSL